VCHAINVIYYYALALCDPILALKFSGHSTQIPNPETRPARLSARSIKTLEPESQTRNQVREAEREKHPELSFGDLSKLVGKQWSEMDIEQKQVYLDMEAEDKIRYANEMQVSLYHEDLTAAFDAKGAWSGWLRSSSDSDTMIEEQF
jgi:hypothetical protein